MTKPMTKPRLQKLAKSTSYPSIEYKYSLLVEARARLSEQRDCSIIALALASGVSYEESRRVLGLYGRRPASGATYSTICGALSHLGLDYTRASLPEAKTLKTLHRESWAYDGVYLVFTATHVACLRDGQLIDWAIDTKKRIVGFWKIQDECQF